MIVLAIVDKGEGYEGTLRHSTDITGDDAWTALGQIVFVEMKRRGLFASDEAFPGNYL